MLKDFVILGVVDMPSDCSIDIKFEDADCVNATRHENDNVTINTNLVELAGVVAGDVVKILARGSSNELSLCYFYLKTMIVFHDEKLGIDRTRTEHHKIISFGKGATFVAKNIKKGMPVSLKGEIRTNKWRNCNGQPRIHRDIRLNSVSILTKHENLNKATIVGEVVSPPSVISLESKFVSLLIKTSIPKKFSHGDLHELDFKNEIHKVVAFNDVSEYLFINVKKGDLLHVEGEIVSSFWTEKSSGEKRKAQEIMASVVRLPAINQQV